jgi:hypothetical protein
MDVYFDSYNQVLGGTPQYLGQKFTEKHLLNIVTPSRDRAHNKNISCKLCLPPAFTLVSCLAYSWTLKMEVTYSPET